MIGSLPLPTFSNSHHHGSGFQGSPVDPKALRLLRSCFSVHLSPHDDNARIKVGEIPSTSILCLEQNSHMRSGSGKSGAPSYRQIVAPFTRAPYMSHGP